MEPQENDLAQCKKVFRSCTTLDRPHYLLEHSAPTECTSICLRKFLHINRKFKVHLILLLTLYHRLADSLSPYQEERTPKEDIFESEIPRAMIPM